MEPKGRLVLILLALSSLGSWSVSSQTLAHRYSFQDVAGSTDFVDSVGGANGTLNNATAGNPGSASLDGTELLLDGSGGYANLPAGIISNYAQLTVEFWADFSSSNPFW